VWVRPVSLFKKYKLHDTLNGSFRFSELNIGSLVVSEHPQIFGEISRLWLTH